MRWTPRQRAMLAEMGTPLWFAPEVEVEAEPAVFALKLPQQSVAQLAAEVTVSLEQ